MYINIISWEHRISKIETRCDYKQNEIVYKGRVLRCSYKDEYCEPAAQFRHRFFGFKINTVLFFPINLKQK